VAASILDPRRVPTAELAGLYKERWEIAVAIAELKSQLRGARVVLRFKLPGAGAPGGLGPAAGAFRHA
jgi:hypothetical protein